MRGRTKTMAKAKTRGWYFFNDGYSIWVNGMSAAELKQLSVQHQGLRRFQWTA